MSISLDILCIFSDGSGAQPCFNFEHSWGDGLSVLRLLQECANTIEHGTYIDGR
jgi:hypothetical protein